MAVQRGSALSAGMFRRVPVLTISLLVWLTLCFLFQWSIKAFDYPNRIWAFLGVSRPLIGSGHFLRLLTASFFHVNPGHFISNAAGLIFCVAILEYTAGPWRALLVVLAGALGGTVGSVAFEWVQNMVGASTILFGVYGALGVLIIKYRKELGTRFALIISIWFLILTGSIMAGYMSLKVVDQGAHIGGFITGALAAVITTRGHCLHDLQKPVSLRMKIGAAALAAVFGIGFCAEVLVLWPLLQS